MNRAATLFLSAATGLVLVAVVTGFTLIPSPARQRLLNLDAKRVYALSSLTYAISSHAGTTGKLPESLEELAQSNQQARNNLDDVATGRPYEYVKGQDFQYQLCATFDAPTPQGSYADFRHAAGRQCMSKNAKPKS